MPLAMAKGDSPRPHFRAAILARGADLPVPGLRSYGLCEEQVDAIVIKAAQASSMKANPITLTPGELAATLRAAL